MVSAGKTPRLIPSPPNLAAGRRRHTQEERNMCERVRCGDVEGVKSLLAQAVAADKAQTGAAAAATAFSQDGQTGTAQLLANLLTGGGTPLLVVAAGITVTPSAGAKKDATDNGSDQAAAQICTALLSAGAAPCSTDRSTGRSAIHVAVVRAHTATMEALYRHGRSSGPQLPTKPSPQVNARR